MVYLYGILGSRERNMYDIGSTVEISIIVNETFALCKVRQKEKKTIAKIIGKEFGWWLKQPQDIYAFLIPEYPFTFRMTNEQLNNCKIRIDDNVARVLFNDKVKSM